MTPETAEDILNRISTDTTTKGRVKFEDALKAMKEIASLAWEASYYRYQEEEYGLIPYKKPGKETFINGLFPDKV